MTPSTGARETTSYGTGQGNDMIVDFTDGEDAIDVTGLIGITSFSDLSITADGNATLIDLTDHGGARSGSRTSRSPISMRRIFGSTTVIRLSARES